MVILGTDVPDGVKGVLTLRIFRRNVEVNDFTNDDSTKKDFELSKSFLWCHQESNRGHKDFQSFALPTELWHH